MKNLKYILAILTSVTVVASLSGCSNKKSSESGNNSVVYYDEDNNSYLTPEEEELKAKENAVITEGKLNTPAEVDGFSVNVKKVITLGYREANGGRQDPAARIAVNLEITNNTSEIAEISDFTDFTVESDGNNYFSMDPETSAIASSMIDDYDFLASELEPGQTTSGYIVFEVNKDWKEMIIAYNPTTANDTYDAVEYKITPDMVTEP